MADALQVGQLVFSAEDNAEVMVLAVYGDGDAAIKRPDGLVPCRPLSALTPLEPRVGDRVRVVSLFEGRSIGLRVGDEAIAEDIAHYNGESWARLSVPDGAQRRLGWGRFILLSRAPSPKSSETVQPQRFYGTMPDPLPKTLPAGTQCKSVVAVSQLTLDPARHSYVGQFRHSDCSLSDPRAWVAVETVSWELVPVQPSEPEGWQVGGEVKGINFHSWDRGVRWDTVERDGVVYRGKLRCIDGDIATIETDHGPRHCNIASLRPISPPPSVSTQCPECRGDHRVLTCEACGVDPAAGPDRSVEVTMRGKEVVSVRDVGGSSTPDPYAEHNAWLQKRGGESVAASATDRYAREARRLRHRRESSSDDPFDRLAASRRKLAQSTEQLGRKVERRHESDWPVDDVPSNVYLNGKP